MVVYVKIANKWVMGFKYIGDNHELRLFCPHQEFDEMDVPISKGVGAKDDEYEYKPVERGHIGILIPGPSLIWLDPKIKVEYKLAELHNKEMNNAIIDAWMDKFPLGIRSNYPLIHEVVCVMKPETRVFYQGAVWQVRNYEVTNETGRMIARYVIESPNGSKVRVRGDQLRLSDLPVGDGMKERIKE